jgi:hypothetical protein
MKNFAVKLGDAQARADFEEKRTEGPCLNFQKKTASLDAIKDNGQTHFPEGPPLANALTARCSNSGLANGGGRFLPSLQKDGRTYCFGDFKEVLLPVLEFHARLQRAYEYACIATSSIVRGWVKHFKDRNTRTSTISRVVVARELLLPRQRKVGECIRENRCASFFKHRREC